MTRAHEKGTCSVCSGEVIKHMGFDDTDLVEFCFCSLYVKLSKLPNLSLSLFANGNYYNLPPRVFVRIK